MTVTAAPLKEHKKPTACKFCKAGGLAWHRDKNTRFAWRMWPATLARPGVYVPDLSQPMHACQASKVARLDEATSAAADAEAEAFESAAPAPAPLSTPARIAWEQPPHPAPTPAQTPFQTAHEATPAPTPGTLEALIAAAVAPLLNVKARLDVEEVRRIVAEMIGAPKTSRLEITRPDASVSVVEGAHFQFPSLLYWVNERLEGMRLNVMLYGKPGTAKTTSARMIAKTLGLSYSLISLNPQTPESRLIGYKDANGVYHRTLFREAFEFGGVYVIDEIDNASDALLTSLNSAVGNHQGAFPDGMVARHPDFVLIATANTPGRGGDANHAGRRPLDAATIDRSVVIEWQYDRELEARIVHGINPNASAWVTWIQTVRAHCAEHHPRLVVSPRASMFGAVALRNSPFTLEEIADQVLFKGFDKDSKAKILRACPLPSVVRPAVA